jgi:hypothetical protein
LGITIHSNVEAPLLWLEEFFGADSSGETHSAPRCGVSLTIDPERYAHTLGTAGAGGSRTIECFALDGRFEHLDLCRDAPDQLLLHDSRAQAFLSLEPADEAIEIIASEDHRRVRILLMRVVRELAIRQALHHGDLLIHGAAAVYRGRAVVIAGQKRSGKTTMLLGLLRRRQAQYLSNDRVLIDLSGTPAVVRGVPTIAKVREDSLRYLPGLLPPGDDLGFRHHLTLRESATGSALMEATSGQIPPMSPAQLCRWLGVEPSASAPMAMLVFPRVDPKVEGFSVRTLDVAEAADSIHASLFSAGAGRVVSEAFGRGWRGRVPDAGETIDACRQLARLGIALECRLGPLAFHAPDVWDAIIARGLTR